MISYDDVRTYEISKHTNISIFNKDGVGFSSPGLSDLLKFHKEIVKDIVVWAYNTGYERCKEECVKEVNLFFGGC